MPKAEPEAEVGPVLRLYGWRSRPLLGVAMLSAAVGFSQFSPAAILADVADYFGEPGPGDSVAEQAGLSGTVLGIGLALVRLASVAAIVLAAVADRRGRRITALRWATLGLVVTIAAAAAPGYWTLVAALAVARPLLSATNTIAGVLAAELTTSDQRAMALAMIAGAYGVGTGAVVVSRAVFDLGFRGVLLLTLVPLILLAVCARSLVEPDRFLLGESERIAQPMRLAFARGLRRRLAVVAALVFGAALITGPANTLLFVYAENVLDASEGFTAALVVAGAPTGLAGLLLGRLVADRLGRRPAAASGLFLLAVSVMVAYSGTQVLLVVGFLASVLFGSVFSPPALAMVNELFPTEVRASVAGWVGVSGVLGATLGLYVVGSSADALGSFSAALAVVCVPAAAIAALAWAVPETRGLELEQSSVNPDGTPLV